MVLSAQLISDFGDIIDSHGSTVSVYLSPTYTLDTEGNDTITKGTATSAKALLFSERGEFARSEVEGIDMELKYEAYLKSTVGTIAENDIIEWSSEYFRILSIEKNPLDTETITFYAIVMERIQPQSKVS
jgi:hypothetical protein